MSDSREIRWFRYGGARWALAITIASLGVLAPLRFVIGGIAMPGGGGLVIVGAVLLLVCVTGAYGALRSGIGVTSDQVLIRSGIGTTQAVPWSKVARFEVRVNPVARPA